MSCNLTEPHPILGSLYIIHGSIYLVLYVPCIIVMIKTKLYKLSCYRIMLFMGVLDVLNLCNNALLAGYYSIIGRNYCADDRFMPIIGAVALGMWAAYCACCILLAFNRCIDLGFPSTSEKLFEGKRQLFWLIIPILYGTFFASPLQPKVGYSADFGVWFIMGNSLFHSINNFLTCTALILLYTWLVGMLWIRTRAISTESMSALQKQVILQSFLLCMLTVLACISYIVIQVAPVTTDFYKLSQFSWQACHGGNAVIYLTLNRTIRNAVFKSFCKCYQPSSTVVSTIPQLNQNFFHHGL